MTAHELAQKLLAGPNHPVVLGIACAHDTVSSRDEEDEPIEIEISEGTKVVRIEAYVEEAKFGWLD